MHAVPDTKQNAELNYIIKNNIDTQQTIIFKIKYKNRPEKSFFETKL